MATAVAIVKSTVQPSWVATAVVIVKSAVQPSWVATAVVIVKSAVQPSWVATAVAIVKSAVQPSWGKQWAMSMPAALEADSLPVGNQSGVQTELHGVSKGVR